MNRDDCVAHCVVSLVSRVIVGCISEIDPAGVVGCRGGGFVASAEFERPPSGVDDGHGGDARDASACHLGAKRAAAEMGVSRNSRPGSPTNSCRSKNRSGNPIADRQRLTED